MKGEFQLGWAHHLTHFTFALLELLISQLKITKPLITIVILIFFSDSGMDETCQHQTIIMHFIASKKQSQVAESRLEHREWLVCFKRNISQVWPPHLHLMLRTVQCLIWWLHQKWIDRPDAAGGFHSYSHPVPPPSAGAALCSECGSEVESWARVGPELVTRIRMLRDQDCQRQVEEFWKSLLEVDATNNEPSVDCGEIWSQCTWDEECIFYPLRPI